MNSVTVIIPNYNGIEHLPECLNSLKFQTYKNFDIIICDDASTDKSIEFIKDNYPEIKIIPSNKRNGFAANINKGIREALKGESKYFLLLNNDIVCEYNFIEKYIESIIEEGIYFSACKMNNYYDKELIDDCGIILNQYGHPNARGNGEIDKGQYDAKGKVFGCCAGAGMYKREIFERNIFFDEKFIAYYEDVDLAIRININGMLCGYTSEAICYHKRGGTYGKKKYYDTLMCSRNLPLIIYKNYTMEFLKRKIFKMFEGELRKYYHLIKNFYFKELFYTLTGRINGIFTIILNRGLRSENLKYATNKEKLFELF